MIYFAGQSSLVIMLFAYISLIILTYLISREKVTIPATKPCITIQGAGRTNTIVQWGDTAGTIGPDGYPLGTYNSATFGVNSQHFAAKNITFKVLIIVS